MSLLIASIIHDFAHPGVNNPFLINSQAPMAICYNDSHVLESFHVAAGFQVLLKPHNNFLCHLPPADWAVFRKVVIDLVMATDLSSHFQILEQFKTRAPLLQMDSADDRKMMMQIVLKCGDISHPVKKASLHHKWSELVTEEFFLQADQEKAMGLPPAMFMDRHNTNLPKSQIGFINVLVKPLIDEFCQVNQNQFWSDCLQKNLQMWQNKLQEQEDAKRVDNKEGTSAHHRTRSVSVISGGHTRRPSVSVQQSPVLLPTVRSPSSSPTPASS
eukprot:TRINITY_DN3637_c0_g1_i9.p1 TRINITY_DN3637_c0_g1~~TRINITY_DN3637_c0_g1_i9.p1  ORF type:complete len:272 (+),score=53.04 TRINITY_DN3637_c0_g1_i9:52-867(+)